jgi:hypothetical protein
MHRIARASFLEPLAAQDAIGRFGRLFVLDPSSERLAAELAHSSTTRRLPQSRRRTVTAAIQLETFDGEKEL